MKRKILRISRWLERLSNAYDDEKWPSAVAAADCLNAEATALRNELYSLLSNETDMLNNVSIFSNIIPHFKTLAIALIIVILTSIPLAVEAEKKFPLPTVVSTENRLNIKNLTWLSEEEAELLAVFRSNYFESADMNLVPYTRTASNVEPINAVRSSPKQEAKNQAKKDKNLKPNQLVGFDTPKKVANKPENFGSEEKTKKPSLQEDLLSLIQVGEKALRGDSYGIKVVN